MIDYNPPSCDDKRAATLVCPSGVVATLLAEGEIRLWWVAEVCSTMKYPKRSHYKHAKQKKYHVRNRAEYNEGLCMRARNMSIVLRHYLLIFSVVSSL